jgi:hypothetical protein
MARNGDPLSRLDNRHADELEATALATAPAELQEIGRGGELVPVESDVPQSFRDTVSNPTYVGVDASRDRLDLARRAGVLETALDIADTIEAKNSLEKMLAAQMALLHKASMLIGQRLVETADRMEGMIDYQRRDNLTCQTVRLANALGRATAEFQAGILTLQKLRSGGRQVLTVQHISVKDGGQAVVAGQLNGRGTDPK